MSCTILWVSDYVCLLANSALVFYSNCYFYLVDNFDKFHADNFALCSVGQKMQCLWGKGTVHVDLLQILSWKKFPEKMVRLNV